MAEQLVGQLQRDHSEVPAANKLCSGGDAPPLLFQHLCHCHFTTDMLAEVGRRSEETSTWRSAFFMHSSLAASAWPRTIDAPIEVAAMSNRAVVRLFRLFLRQTKQLEQQGLEKIEIRAPMNKGESRRLLGLRHLLSPPPKPQLPPLPAAAALDASRPPAADTANHSHSPFRRCLDVGWAARLDAASRRVPPEQLPQPGALGGRGGLPSEEERGLSRACCAGVHVASLPLHLSLAGTQVQLHKGRPPRVTSCRAPPAAA